MGYHPTSPSWPPTKRKRMDKFFYTGMIETVPVTESQDVTGRLGGAGIGAQAEVVAWDRTQTGLGVSKGRLMEQTWTGYLDDEMALSASRVRGVLCRARIIYVSDHFGATVGISVKSGPDEGRTP